MTDAASPRPTVLITGAARRIGRAIALSMAEAGYDVAVHYRHSKLEAEGLVREIEALGQRAGAFPADLARQNDVEALIPAISKAMVPPICLVNNASEFQFDSLASLTPERWATHMDINLKAPVFLAQALAANLPVGAQGHVINIIDQRVWKLTPEFFSYTLSKAGLWTATKTLAQALAPHVRVNAIGPGPVLRSIHQSADEFAAEEATTLLQRGSTPEEIASAVRFLVSAPAITGQMIALDGGQHLGWNVASPAH
jgi:NAD(P)-dependent dehydrogenase (short-subunit alcohol dehydrogenase family)